MAAEGELGEPVSDSVVARRRGCAVDPARLCARRPDFFVLDRRCAEQAAREDGFELDKPTGSRCCAWRTSRAASGRCRRAKINGIGPKSSAKLEALGIRTIGRARGRRSGAWLSRASSGGRTARGCIDAAHGRDERIVRTRDAEPKSISRETTFDRDTLGAARPRRALRDLHGALRGRMSSDLRRKAGVGKTIGLKLALRQFQDGDARQDDLSMRPTDAGGDPAAPRGECLQPCPARSRFGSVCWAFAPARSFTADARARRAAIRGSEDATPSLSTRA